MFEIDKSSFSDRELKVLEFWKNEGVFKQSIENRKQAELFSFYDGPPFATGLPHYGHLLASTIKDVVARFKTMEGFCVPRRFGWDCHGLPVESEIEKEYNLKGEVAVREFGIARYNEECRKIVLRYTSQWKETIERMGRWVEFDKTYRTMDVEYMESVWWVFSRLFDQGLVYEGYKVMPFSPHLGTPLSNFEANLNYKEVQDPSLTVKFKLTDVKDTYFLAWTTTPWTLPSNLALGVGQDIDYVQIKLRDSGEIYYLAKERLKSHFKNESEFEVLDELKGSELVDTPYEPLFDYFYGHENAFRILAASFVTTTGGTGIVHLAPAFGEDDFYLCKEHNIDPVCPITQNCCFTKQIPEYEGKFVKDADKEIIKRLKGEGKILSHATIMHRYPFCWRSDAPLIYKAISTWFVSVEKIKDKIIKNNQKIHWVPEHIKDGRFGKWLEGARDWAISRNRFWGTPLPIFRSEDGDILVLSSKAELEEKTGQKIEDLHSHFIDDLVVTHNGRVYKRVKEVFDCWFESGSMPYAQNHYPFENKDETEKCFPADFIAEGLDQTRGWFYTLNVLSTAVMGEPAFKNVIVNGIVLAEDGQKMSKRLKNYPDPMEVINIYGSDAIRLYLLHSPVVRGEDVSFTKRGVEIVSRSFLIPFFNSYIFLATYARIYNYQPYYNEDKISDEPIDRWILSRMQKLIDEVKEGMDHYHLEEAVEPFVAFIEEMTNWYIRRSRARFWSDDDTPDRRSAFDTLYRVLITLCKIAAPYIPFLSEGIYQQLKRGDDQSSVHLCDFPKSDESLRDLALEFEMQGIKQVVTAGHSLRKEHHIKVRQPLGHAHIVCSDHKTLSALEKQKDLIKDELNVKDLTFNFDEAKFVTLKPKPNFRTLGKRVGGLMRHVQQEIQGLDQGQLKALAQKEPIEVSVQGEIISLTEEDVCIERQVRDGLVAAVSGSITIALDLHISKELEVEGIARELVNKINTLRKSEKFEVTDRIDVELCASEKVVSAFKEYDIYIRQETLIHTINFVQKKCTHSLQINNEDISISITNHN
jgi:isoleucyl-tRNA synthetase